MVELFNASYGDVNEMFLRSIEAFNINPLWWDVCSGPVSAKRSWDARDFPWLRLDLLPLQVTKIHKTITFIGRRTRSVTLLTAIGHVIAREPH